MNAGIAFALAALLCYGLGDVIYNPRRRRIALLVVG